MSQVSCLQKTTDQLYHFVYGHVLQATPANFKWATI